MRCRPRTRLAFLWLLLAGACKSDPHPAVLPVSSSDGAAASGTIASGTSPPAPSAPRPVSSELVALQQRLRQKELRLPARTAHRARLAFGRGVLAQLGDDALRIYSEAEPGPTPIVVEPVEGPRAVLALPDGSLLAADARRLLRWEPGAKRVKSLPRPILLPDTQLFADAQRSDRLWLFEPARAGEAARLSRFVLGESEGVAVPAVPLPEQTIELPSVSSGVLGLTLEGVWLYLTPGHAERFAPSGARLAPLKLGSSPLPAWVLPAPRVDHGSWLTEDGELSRVLVSPSFQRLAARPLPGPVFAADVADRGRLLATIAITGEGPRFELFLFDAELRERARVLLPADEPTLGEDWVQVVTRNQELVASPRAARVAVGGSSRAAVFDAAGKVIFTIPSR